MSGKPSQRRFRIEIADLIHTVDKQHRSLREPSQCLSEARTNRKSIERRPRTGRASWVRPPDFSSKHSGDRLPVFAISKRPDEPRHDMLGISLCREEFREQPPPPWIAF